MLNDSPVGLAAWIVEKFRTWSDCGGELQRIFTKDELLTNVMIYWVSETLNSSARLYYETREQPLQLSPTNRVEVPVAMAVFPKKIPIPPRSLAERGYNSCAGQSCPGAATLPPSSNPAFSHRISENSSVPCARGFTAPG